MRRFYPLILFCFALLLTQARFAAALPTFPAIVMKAYPLKAGGAIATATQKCLLCHTQVPKLNPYGMAIKAALKGAGTKTLTAEILHSVDDQDSDGDSATNAQEFAADTLPGDAASKPAVIAPPKNGAKSAASAEATDEPSPWAIQTILFPKHAQHPVVVHFPIALLMIALLFDFLGARTKNRSLHAAAYYNIAAAAFFAPISVVTGLLAWWFKFVPHPYTGSLLSQLTSDSNTLYHLIMGVVSMAVVFGLWALRRNELRGDTTTFRPAYVVLGVLALPIIAITGHLGGILSGV